MILIEVLPLPREKNWGVFIDSELFAKSKHSFDCDFAAIRLGKILEAAEVRHYPEMRNIDSH